MAASLFRRQEINAAKALRLWLVHMVPFLRELRGKAFVVVDYDLLMLEPRRELERIAHTLSLPSLTKTACGIDRFAGFLNANLRHSVFSADDFDTRTGEGRLARDAYTLLYDLATDRRRPSAAFWSVWENVEYDLESVLR